MGKYFGTDGFRGEANIDLNASQAFKVGRILGYYYSTQKKLSGDTKKAKILIGKDTRRSSYMLEYAICAGATSSGADCYIMHVTTTPSVAYITKHDNFDCGVMITASHNPFYDNGIKVISSTGDKISDDIIQVFEDMLDSNDEIPYATKDEIGSVIDYVAGRNRYIGYLISLGIFSFDGLHIGLDCANGSSWMIAKSVFEALGAKVYAINNTPDGLNVNKDCGSTHIEGLQELVRSKGLDIGFAFDGDADRCLAVDELGNVVNGDQIIYMYAKYMKDRDKLINNTAVVTVMSNFGLFKAFDAEGINYAKTKVGDRYVKEYMEEHNCSIGGEQSGHIIFSKYATTGDGILTALKVMQVLLDKKLPLSKLVEPCIMYPQVLVNVKVTSKEIVVNDLDIKNLVQEVSNELSDTGRVLLRESGTEPVIRVMCEAQTLETCHHYVDKLVNLIIKKGYAVK